MTSILGIVDFCFSFRNFGSEPVIGVTVILCLKLNNYLEVLRKFPQFPNSCRTLMPVLFSPRDDT